MTTKKPGPATRAIHGGHARTGERENSPPLFLTSSFAFDSAAQAQAVFDDSETGNLYSRFTNPTVALFEERLAALEGAEKGLATASGMGAIFTAFMSLLSAGDHVVISQSVFGSTTNIATGILPRFGIEVTRVPLSDLDAWNAAIQDNTKLFLLETPANPTLEMGDIAAIAEIARKRGVLTAVDNVFCTPILQKPLALGADIALHSATKYIDGQGRVLGGAILGREELLMETIFPFIRNTGPTLSAFNAWVLAKGLETLQIRMERHCANARIAAETLAANPALAGKVRYPGLPDHPQHELAARQMSGFGGLVCLELDNRDRAHAFIDALELITVTANLGDAKTLVTHPATTTHGRLQPEDRATAGITDGLVRLSIGLEDPEDIIADLERALDKSAG